MDDDELLDDDEWCECDAPDPIDDEPWRPAVCGTCGRRI